MARPRKAPTDQQRMAEFAIAELNDLVNTLGQERDFVVSAPDLLGALVLFGRLLPPEVVVALVGPYVKRERAEIARLRAAETDTDE